MQRVFPLIWLLVLGLAGAQLASVVAMGTPCCQGEASQSDNCCSVLEASLDASDASQESRPGHSSCCSTPATDSSPEAPDDTPRDHDPERHPCKCPAQCCVVSKAPVTFTVLPSLDTSTGHAPLYANEWREPLPNPTLDRLKRPPRTHATV